MPTPDVTIEMDPDLMIADLDGEAVILDPRSGKYFGLNRVGARVVELTRTPQTLSEIVEIVQSEFDVDADRLRDDLEAFIESLESHHLLQVIMETSA